MNILHYYSDMACLTTLLQRHGMSYNITTATWHVLQHYYSDMACLTTNIGAKRYCTLMTRNRTQLVLTGEGAQMGPPYFNRTVH